MWSNKLEYSTVAGFSCTTHVVKVPLCMPQLSSRKIIEHRFRFYSDKGKLDIGYEKIVFHDLMVQLGLMVKFKRQVLQCDGATVPMEELRDLLGNQIK